MTTELFWVKFCVFALIVLFVAYQLWLSRRTSQLEAKTEGHNLKIVHMDNSNAERFKDIEDRLDAVENQQDPMKRLTKLRKS